MDEFSMYNAGKMIKNWKWSDSDLQSCINATMLASAFMEGMEDYATAISLRRNLETLKDIRSSRIPF